jgi:hypothetical protein
MSVRQIIYRFALLAGAAAAASSANAQTIDPASDLDCAIIFQFYHGLAVRRNAPADEIDLTLVMNSWFTTEWDRAHPGEADKQFDHYIAVVKTLGDDPNAYREMIRTCSHRAFSEPGFEAFWILHHKVAPGTR